MSSLKALQLSDAPFKMKITNPKTGAVMKDKDGKEAFILVKSISSVEATDFKRQLYEEARKNRKRNKDNGVSYDEVIQRSSEMLADLTEGWYLVDFQGVPIDEPFSRETAITVYANPQMDWLKRQVDEAINDDANFMPT